MLETVFDAKKEQKILLEIIEMPENNNNKWEILFNHINFVINKIYVNIENMTTINEKNIRKVVKLIKDNELDSRPWNNDEILFDEQALIDPENCNLTNINKYELYMKKHEIFKVFQEIMSTPIFLPATFLGLLSGEFLIYLIQKNKSKKIEFYHKRDFKSETLIQYYYSKSSYLQQFKNNFRIDFSKISKDKDKDKNKNKNKNKNKDKAEDKAENKAKDKAENKAEDKAEDKAEAEYTKSWIMFGIFDYVNFDVHKYNNLLNAEKKQLDSTNLLTSLKKFYIPSSYFADINLNINLTNLIILRTLFIQQISEGDLKKLSTYFLYPKMLMASIARVIGLILQYFHVADVSDKMITYFFENDFDNLKIITEDISIAIDKFCANVTEQLKRDKENNKKIIATDENLIFTIVWQMIGQENFNFIKAKQNVHKLKSNLYNFTFKTNSKEFLKINSWEEFYNNYKITLTSLIPNTSEEKVKETLLLALHLISYCYPEKHNYSIDSQFFPLELTNDWLKEYSFFTQKIKMYELFATMYLVIVSKDFFVKTEGKKIKIYYDLENKEKESKTKPPTLNSIIKNTKNYDSENLKRQLKIWLHNQIIIFFSSEQVFLNFEKLIDTCFKMYENAFETSQNIEKEICIYKDILEPFQSLEKNLNEILKNGILSNMLLKKIDWESLEKKL